MFEKSNEEENQSVQMRQFTTKRAIIFDLGGVILKPCPMRIVFYLNKFAMLYYLFVKYKSLSDLKVELFDVLSAKTGEGTISSYPFLMEKWFKNEICNDALLDIIKDVIGAMEKSSAEKCLLDNLAHIIFDPKRFANTMVPYDGFDLLKKIPNDIPIYLISNFNDEAYEEIVKLYPNLFSRFDDVIVSGKVSMIKPAKSIYEYAISKWGLTPQDVLYIDDEEDNIKTAETLGFQTVLYDCPKMAAIIVEEYMKGTCPMALQHLISLIPRSPDAATNIIHC